MTRERGIAVEVRLCHGWMGLLWLVAFGLLWAEQDERWGLFATGIAMVGTIGYMVSRNGAMMRYAYELGREESAPAPLERVR